MSGNADYPEPLKPDLKYLLAGACSLKHLNRREPRISAYPLEGERP